MRLTYAFDDYRKYIGFNLAFSIKINHNLSTLFFHDNNLSKKIKRFDLHDYDLYRERFGLNGF